VLFYLKKNAPKKNGKVAIMCRITIDGKQAQFSTKLEVLPDKRDLKYGRVLGKAQEALKAKDFINDFDYYLRVEVGIIHNTVWTYMLPLRTRKGTHCQRP